MVLKQELFRQITLQKEELFRLVVSNEQYKNCNNNGKATENVKKSFFTTVCLPCNSILPHGCACFIYSCRSRCEKYYRLNSYNTRISPRPNVCVTAQTTVWLLCSNHFSVIHLIRKCISNDCSYICKYRFRRASRLNSEPRRVFCFLRVLPFRAQEHIVLIIN